MTDHPNSQVPSDPGPPSADADLPPDQLAALVGMLRDVPAVSVERRSAHLAAAMQAFDELAETAPTGATPSATNASSHVAASPVPNVVKLDSRRRGRVKLRQRLVVAAAAVTLAGTAALVLGRTTSRHSTSLADNTTAKTAGDSAAVKSAANDVESEPAAAAAPSTVVHLGAFPDDAALAARLDADELGPMSRPGTDFAGAAAEGTGGAPAPASEPVPPEFTEKSIDSCAGTVPSGASALADATVDGRPVAVVSIPSTTGGAPTRIVVDLTTCATRTL